MNWHISDNYERPDYARAAEAPYDYETINENDSNGDTTNQISPRLLLRNLQSSTTVYKSIATSTSRPITTSQNGQVVTQESILRRNSSEEHEGYTYHSDSENESTNYDDVAESKCFRPFPSLTKLSVLRTDN